MDIYLCIELTLLVKRIEKIILNENPEANLKQNRTNDLLKYPVYPPRGPPQPFRRSFRAVENFIANGKKKKSARGNFVLRELSTPF